jgi:DNA-binding NtrC family response regulator
MLHNSLFKQSNSTQPKSGPINMIDVLIVEDDDLDGRLLENDLCRAGFKVRLVCSLKSARKSLLNDPAPLVLADYQLPDGNGNQLMEWADTRGINSSFFLMSAFGTINRAVEAIKLGARDFFEKPLNRKLLISNLQRQFSNKKKLSDFQDEAHNDNLIVGKSPNLKQAFRLAEIASSKSCNIFIKGESGTGKEVMARYIHHLSNRRNGPFVGINCASIPDSLVESELFGYKKGAFTNADNDKKGKLVQAVGGTLFLDEIGDMPLQIQTKLLRVLEERKAVPLGSNEEILLDFRLICATHKDLNKLVAKGLFREDLFFRFHVLEISLPPLRQRPEDIPLLLQKFLVAHMNKKEAEKEIRRLPRFVLQYPWPGNVRELKNAAERFSVLRETGLTWREVIPKTQPKSSFSASNKRPGQTPRIKRISDEAVFTALEKCGYRRDKTAEYLNISLRTLQYRLAAIKNLG